jgi:hypothetical protein
MRPVAVLIVGGTCAGLIVDRIISLQDGIPTGDVGLRRVLIPPASVEKCDRHPAACDALRVQKVGVRTLNNVGLHFARSGLPTDPGGAIWRDFQSRIALQRLQLGWRQIRRNCIDDRKFVRDSAAGVFYCEQCNRIIRSLD